MRGMATAKLVLMTWILGQSQSVVHEECLWQILEAM